MFTQKLSMDCTQEQYEKYLKEELEKMGYGLQGYLFDDAILVNNSNGENGQLIMLGCNSKHDHSRTYLGKFNAPLFLALAAMTDKEDGNYGQYWICKIDGFSFTKDRLYKQVGYSYNSPDFIDDKGNRNGVWWDILNCNFRKATVSEIMAKFGEQPQKDIYITLAFEKEPIWENCEKDIEEYEAIHLLKSKGYRIFKQNTTLEEI